MTDTITIPPMPDTDCPNWCDRDHLRDWQEHVQVGIAARPFWEGGVLRTPTDPGRGRVSSGWLEMFEPLTCVCCRRSSSSSRTRSPA